MIAVLSAFVLALVAPGITTARAQTPAPAAPAAASVPIAATPENAAFFLGDWTLTAEGVNGPATFAVSVKADEGKVTADISSETQPRQAITDVSKNDTSLILRYTFDYQGMAVPVVVSMKPAEDKTGVQLDFADGAYQMVGTAAKNKPAAK
jgi:hypothetical protein